MPVLPQTLGWIDPYAEQRAALQARMGQPVAPMFSPEEAAQRRAQNEREHALGILGQLSGDEAAAPVGGTLLKNALANRQPRVTERGVSDPLTGKFSYSPDYLQQQQQTRLDALDAKSAADKAEWNRDRAAAEDRKILKSLGGGAGGGIDAAGARVYAIEDRMADDFDRDTKTARMVKSAHANLKAIAQRDDAASDIAFIFSYMKMLDPTSVVREGEFANVQNAAGVPDQIRNAYNRVLQGTRMNPQQRADMLGAAGRIAGEADIHIRESANQYREKATRRRVNPDNVAPQISASPPMTPPAAPAPAAPVPGAVAAPAAPAAPAFSIRLKGAQ